MRQLVWLVLVLAMACGGAQSPAQSAATPDGAFEAMQRAESEGDTTLAFEFIRPAERPLYAALKLQMTGVLFTMLQRSAPDPGKVEPYRVEYDALRARYHAPAFDLAAIGAQLGIIAGNIPERDAAGVAHRCYNLVLGVTQDLGAQPNLERLSVDKLRIEDERAFITPKQAPVELEMVREDGRWYLDVVVMIKLMLRGRPAAPAQR